MSFVVLLIIILGVGLGILTIFVVRAVIAPKQLAAVQELLKQDRVPAAARAAKALIQRDARNGPARYAMGLVYLAENKPELALMEFKAAEQIGAYGPDLPEAKFRAALAGLYARFGQTEEALTEYILLTKLEPSESKHFLACGRLFDERGKTDVAVGYLRKALELDPRSGEAHYALGYILYRTKHPVEARSELDLAIKYDQTNYDAYYYLGKLLKESNDYTAALLVLERAQKSPTLKTKALVERGGCYMSMGAFDKAVVELERAVKGIKDEGSSEALYGRYFLAMCYEKTRNLDRAIDQWEKIYARKPQFRDVAEKLSQYQEYRADDRMKEYVTCSRDEFTELCKTIAMQAMSMSIRDTAETPNGVDFITVENDSEKWLGTKKMPRLFRFLRVSEVLDETSVRALLDQMKKLNIVRGVVITSSGFTRTALEFAENRAVELIGKEQLQLLLDQVELPQARRR
ncbi:MAG: tetratricopeptide repeat protein [Spirochaetales bacterium]|nr:tetratricopeptide repeat protein [Spirochaetales bacterium]